MKIVLSILALSFYMVACGPQTQTNEQENATETETTESVTAIANLSPASGSEVQGTARFTQTDQGVRMELEVSGLEPGSVHALHIHEHGDCSAHDATSAGGHWNPTNVQHGQRGVSDEFHSGDIDNIQADSDGNARYEFTAEDWSIGGDDATNIIGKSVMIHIKPDDFVSQPTGDAGDRISCGAIEQE